MLISVSMRILLILGQVAGVLRFERLFYRLLMHVIGECCLPLKDYAAHILLLITVSSVLMLRSGLGGLLVDHLAFLRQLEKAKLNSCNFIKFGMPCVLNLFSFISCMRWIYSKIIRKVGTFHS